MSKSSKAIRLKDKTGEKGIHCKGVGVFMDIYRLTARELDTKLKQKELSSWELVNYFLDRIDKLDSSINAFITLCPENALKTAREIDDRRVQGAELPSLAGVPIALKDNISTRGIVTTCGSAMLKNYIPPFNATVVERLQRLPMPILGKTNLDEFAMGSSTENSAFFPTRNPWNREMVAGGSSGGSAAAVATGMAPLALGSDTGGSVRQPAAFCGVNGLRPTYGRVSRYGLVAFASSLDQIGPLSKDAEDGKLLFQTIAGYDPKDSTSLSERPQAFSYLAPPKEEKDLRGVRIGLIKEQKGEGFDYQVLEKVNQVAKFFETHGATVEEVSLPLTQYALAAYYLINPAEASSNLGRYDGVRYGLSHREVADAKELFFQTRGVGFGQEVKRRIVLGTYGLSAGYYDQYYLQALKARTMIRESSHQALQKYHLLMGPTTPTPAFKVGEKVEDPLEMYLSDVCTVNDPLAGNPAVSMLAGLSEEGLPIGVHLASLPFRESFLLGVARWWEQSQKFPLPPLSSLEGGASR